MDDSTKLDLERRALKSYRARIDADPDPTVYATVVTHAGLSYAAVAGFRGVRTVYRVQANGKLRRLRRWPAAVERAA